MNGGLARLAGLALAVCAAFAWDVPWLDRPGAALTAVVLVLASRPAPVGAPLPLAQPTGRAATKPHPVASGGNEPGPDDAA
jgi:hypothetical protein